MSLHSSTFWTASVIFALTYIALAIGKVPRLGLDRAAIAFIGAAMMLVTRVLTLQQAVAPESIDYETLFLLFGMMVVVGFLRISGFFSRLTTWALGQIRTPGGLLAVTILLSGLLSAFLVNDIVCLAITPLVAQLARRLRFNPLPHLIGVATAANIGSTGTITRNPQNMIIGIQSHIPYLRFAAHLLPVAAIGLIINFSVVAWVYRRELVAPQSSQGDSANNDARNKASIGGCSGDADEDLARTSGRGAEEAPDSRGHDRTATQECGRHVGHHLIVLRGLSDRIGRDWRGLIWLRFVNY